MSVLPLILTRPTAPTHGQAPTKSRELLTARQFLAEVEAGPGRLAHLPVLIAWAGWDVASTLV